MKLRYLIFLFVFTTLLSCERDDICIDATTPHLIIRFYDQLDNQETKNVTNLLVSVTNSLNEEIETSSIRTTDSIVIPLNVDMDFTKIKLIKNANIDLNAIEDEFILNYDNQEIFVSRSCGYKMVYNDIELVNQTSNWIQSITTNTTVIDNEVKAHLTIYH